MKKQILAVLALVLIILPMVLAPVPVAAADDWLAGWAYRVSHDVYGTAGATVNYTMTELYVYAGAGASANNTLYLNNHCYNFPEDITFTDDDKTTEIAFWCENISATGAGADPAIFHVKVEDDMSGNNTIYCYYGKSGQATRGNGYATFPLLFEDWNRSTRGSWSLGTSLDVARYAISVPVMDPYNGKAYLIAGYNNTGSRCDAVFSYDIATDTYSAYGALAPYPDGPIAGTSQALVGDCIYVFAGVPTATGTYCNYNRIYNITDDSWSSGANVPYVSEGMFVTVDPTTNLIYVGGGCAMPSGVHDDWYSYNPATDTWTQLADMPMMGANGVCGYYNGAIYIASGTTVAGEDPDDPPWRYNIGSDTWTIFDDKISTKCVTGTGGIVQSQGWIYVIGGKTSFGNTYTNKVQVWDIAAEQWIESGGDYVFSSVPASYGFQRGVLDSDVFYIFGGWDGSTKYDTLRVFNTTSTSGSGVDGSVWTTYNGTVVDGICYLSAQLNYLHSVSTFQYRDLVGKINIHDVTNVGTFGFREGSPTDTLDRTLFMPRDAVTFWDYSNDGAAEWDVVPTSYGAWHIYDLKWQNGQVDFYVDGALNATHVVHPPSAASHVQFYTYPGCYMDIDWVFVRAWVDPEPYHGGWGAEEFTPYLTVSTVAASRVACTTARLNSVIVADGELPVTIRFGYGNATANSIETYQYYQTLTGTYSKDDHPYLDVAGLNASAVHYFRVEGTNAEGSYLGDELTFTTTNLTGAVSGFNGIPSDDSISLWWDPLVGATNYLIRYKANGYPTGIADGTQVYFASSTSTVHEDLTPGTTYWYMIWGESGGTYSSNATLVLTTTAGPSSDYGDGTPADVSLPTEIDRWIDGSDYTNAAGLDQFYTNVNRSSASFDVPFNTAWFILFIGVAVVVALVVYSKHRSQMMALVVAGAVLVLGWLMHLIPFYIPLVGVGIITVSALIGHKEVSNG